MKRIEGDGIYFGRRAKEERVAAMKAPDRRAREAHLEMANRYHDLATAVREHAVEPDPRNAA